MTGLSILPLRPLNPNPRIGTTVMANAVFRRRALAAVESLTHRHRRFFIVVAASASEGPASEAKRFSDNGVLHQATHLGFQARSIHATSVPRGSRASAVSLAEFAVENDSHANGDEGLEIAKLSISEEIVSSLAKKGITKLFPIQRAVLEPAMQGRDMVGRAKTGTGKTLAFGIPIMDKIIKFNAQHGRGRNPLSLVLTPTRELAKQVEKEFQEAAPSLEVICVYGGIPISAQMRQLGRGVDVVVGTPGRVIDLFNRGSLNLSEVRFLVLDEADQMLQIGFQEAVETILQGVPKQRHTMMFSATMPLEIRRITQRYLNKPQDIDLVGESDQKLAEGISLYSIASDMHGRAAIIGPLITEHAKGGKCIVFTQTKRDADQLSFAMSRSYKCMALHGDITQFQRERTLASFRNGHFHILVATDVASRGLDIPNVDLVIHYELPNSSEIFVHRSGRTGRAGKKGTAILVYSDRQTRAVRMIERDVGSRFTELAPVAGDNTVQMGGGQFKSFGGTRGRRSDNGSGRFGGGGGSGRSGFGRSSGYGSNSGGFSSFGDHSGSGSGSSHSGRYGDSSSSGSGRSGRFGDFGSRSGRSGGFEDFSGSRSGRSGSFGDFGSRKGKRNSGSSNFVDDF